MACIDLQKILIKSNIIEMSRQLNIRAINNKLTAFPS